MKQKTILVIAAVCAIILVYGLVDHPIRLKIKATVVEKACNRTCSQHCPDRACNFHPCWWQGNVTILVDESNLTFGSSPCGDDCCSIGQEVYLTQDLKTFATRPVINLFPILFSISLIILICACALWAKYGSH